MITVTTGIMNGRPGVVSEPTARESITVVPDTHESAVTGSTPARAKYCRFVHDGKLDLVQFDSSAFNDAVADYYKHKIRRFNIDLFEYLESGFVISRPNMFVMFKVCQLEGEVGWFVRYAHGNMREMLRQMPVPLKFICFYRHRDSTILKRVDTQAFYNRVMRISGTNGNGRIS